MMVLRAFRIHLLLFFLTFLLSSVGFQGPLLATMVLPLSLSQMTQKSDKIFVGRCLESSSELDENQIPSTYIRFEVLKGLKGVQTGDSVLIKQFGMKAMPSHVEEGQRAIIPLRSLSITKDIYRPGDEMFLFLYGESVLGFTSPVGAGQGRLILQKNNAAEKFLQEGAMDVDQMIHVVEQMVSHER